jgi:hypothetical protein
MQVLSVSEEARGYMARGWLGQYLLVYPEAQLVVVRLHYPVAADYEPVSPDTEWYPELMQDALRLVGEEF